MIGHTAAAFEDRSFSFDDTTNSEGGYKIVTCGGLRQVRVRDARTSTTKQVLNR